MLITCVILSDGANCHFGKWNFMSWNFRHSPNKLTRDLEVIYKKIARSSNSEIWTVLNFVKFKFIKKIIKKIFNLMLDTQKFAKVVNSENTNHGVIKMLMKVLKPSLQHKCFQLELFDIKLIRKISLAFVFFLSLCQTYKARHAARHKFRFTLTHPFMCLV